MSSWARDPETAADALIRRSLDDIDWRGQILLANQAGALPALLTERGIDTVVWNRRLVGGRHAEPWPPAGPFDLALLRLPKARDEQEMAMHACLGALAPGGRLIVYGGNDEGVRSAASVLARVSGPVETLATRGHGRVMAASRPADGTKLRDTLGDWRRVVSLAIAGRTRDWVTYPGIFAADRVDEGTALLLSALPDLPSGAQMLDFGCGSGVIAGALRASNPALSLDLLDNDSVALAAAGENVPGARLILGERLGDAGKNTYDAILSNPPLHKGIAEDHAQLEELIAAAPRHLKPRGILQMVVQRRVPLEGLLAKRFSAQVVAENNRYRVWRCQRA